MFTDEQQMMLNTLHRFLDKEYPPEKIREIDEKDIYPREAVQKLGDLGLTGLTVPEEYGGMGRSIKNACLVTEELAKRSLTLAWAYVECAFFGGENIGQLGNEEQKRYFLPGIANGELIFAYALTEPNTGSDTAAVSTTAIRDGDKFIINGNKTFISGASVSDYMLVLCRTDRNVPKHKGLSFFIVDSHTKGVSTKTIPKLGCHGSDTCDVVLEDVVVPVENLLGGIEMLNKGWQQLLSTLDVEHAHIAAEGAGLAQGALDLAIKYAQERKQFGQSIGSFQAIQHQLAELATEVLAARLMAYYVADLIDKGRPCWKETSMAKLYAAEVAKRVSLSCLEVFGGYGYSMEYDIQRYVRDSIVLPIGGGTAQIQKNIIAKAVGL